MKNDKKQTTVSWEIISQRTYKIKIGTKTIQINEKEAKDLYKVLDDITDDINFDEDDSF